MQSLCITLRALATNKRHTIMYTRYKNFSPCKEPTKQTRYVACLVLVWKLTLTSGSTVSIGSQSGIWDMPTWPHFNLGWQGIRVSLHSNKTLTEPMSSVRNLLVWEHLPVVQSYLPVTWGHLLAMQECLPVTQEHAVIQGHLLAA
jgi:hypothetical protein